MRKRLRRAQKSLVANPAGVLIPGVPDGEHLANGVHQAQVLNEERGLIDTLIVEEGGESVAAIKAAPEDDASGDLAAESHFGKESVYGRASEAFELGDIEWPAGKSETDARKIDMAVAHGLRFAPCDCA